MWNPPKDEIPGETTWLWSENRKRYEWEYSCWPQLLDEYTERLARFGLPINFEKIISYMEEQERKEIALTQEIEELGEKLSNLQEHHHHLENESHHIVAKETLMKNTVEHLHIKILNQGENLLRYGGHTAECYFTERSGVGRPVEDNADNCDCGWWDTQNSLETK